MIDLVDGLEYWMPKRAPQKEERGLMWEKHKKAIDAYERWLLEQILEQEKVKSET